MSLSIESLACTDDCASAWKAWRVAGHHGDHHRGYYYQRYWPVHDHEQNRESDLDKSNDQQGPQVSIHVPWTTVQRVQVLPEEDGARDEPGSPPDYVEHLEDKPDDVAAVGEYATAQLEDQHEGLDGEEEQDIGVGPQEGEELKGTLEGVSPAVEGGVVEGAVVKRDHDKRNGVDHEERFEEQNLSRPDGGKASAWQYHTLIQTIVQTEGVLLMRGSRSLELGRGNFEGRISHPSTYRRRSCEGEIFGYLTRFEKKIYSIHPREKAVVLQVEHTARMLRRKNTLDRQMKRNATMPTSRKESHPRILASKTKMIGLTSRDKEYFAVPRLSSNTHKPSAETQRMRQRTSNFGFKNERISNRGTPITLVTRNVVSRKDFKTTL